MRLFRSATWPTASVDPLLTVPVRRSTLSCWSNLSDLRTATSGLASSSSNSSSNGRPATPPAALISLTASSAPHRTCFPIEASLPDSGVTTPTLIASAACAFSPRLNANAAIALLRTVGVLSMFSSACKSQPLGAREIGLTLLGEGCDAFLVVATFAQLLIGVPLDLEARAEARVVRRVQHPLDGLECERRHGGERRDDVVENAIERRRVIGNAREQAPAVGFRRGDAAAEHHHVHGAGQASNARHALTAAATGNLAESHFRQC